MKVLLLYPPNSDNIMPPVSTSALSGYLNEMGLETLSFDINAEWQNYILTDAEFKQKAKLAYYFLQKRITDYQENDAIINQMVNEKEKETLDYINNIKKHIRFSKLVDNSELYKQTFINNDYFYKNDMLTNASQGLKMFLEIYLRFLDIFELTAIKEYDLFSDFHSDIVRKIEDINPDFIAISVTYYSQMKMSMFLTKLLKRKTNIPVIYGGRFHLYMEKFNVDLDKNFFTDVADIIIVNNSEVALYDLIKSLNDKIGLDNVSNIIYINDNNEIIHNKIMVQPLDKVYNFCYDGLNLNNYFTPELTLPLEISKGCYWNKCTFCDFAEGMKYVERPVDAIIEEIKDNKKKYNVNKFHFVTHNIHPRFAKELSEKIIKEKLDIYYVTYVRLEEEFSKNLLKQLYKSGLRVGHWGLESGSDRVLESVKKGINTKIAARILKDAHQAGIVNQVFAIFGLPTETDEEREETLGFLFKNYNYIDSIYAQPYIPENDEEAESKYDEKQNEKSQKYINKIYTKEYFNKKILAKFSYSTVGLLYAIYKINKKPIWHLFKQNVF